MWTTQEPVQHIQENDKVSIIYQGSIQYVESYAHILCWLQQYSGSLRDIYLSFCFFIFAHACSPVCIFRKKRTVEEILDVRGLRLIVPDEESCYKALEIVQQLWRHIPGKSKDYIADPKPNG